eukprot:scaffold91_cov254-Pinguiococcus_pyrenoidosus.AAC.38
MERSRDAPSGGGRAGNEAESTFPGAQKKDEAEVRDAHDHDHEHQVREGLALRRRQLSRVEGHAAQRDQHRAEQQNRLHGVVVEEELRRSPTPALELRVAKVHLLVAAVEIGLPGQLAGRVDVALGLLGELVELQRHEVVLLRAHVGRVLHLQRVGDEHGELDGAQLEGGELPEHQRLGVSLAEAPETLLLLQCRRGHALGAAVLVAHHLVLVGVQDVAHEAREAEGVHDEEHDGPGLQPLLQRALLVAHALLGTDILDVAVAVGRVGLLAVEDHERRVGEVQVQVVEDHEHVAVQRGGVGVELAALVLEPLVDVLDHVDEHGDGHHDQREAHDAEPLRLVRDLHRVVPALRRHQVDVEVEGAEDVVEIHQGRRPLHVARGEDGQHLRVVHADGHDAHVDLLLVQLVRHIGAGGHRQHDAHHDDPRLIGTRLADAAEAEVAQRAVGAANGLGVVAS